MSISDQHARDRKNMEDLWEKKFAQGKRDIIRHKRMVEENDFYKKNKAYL